MVTDDAGLNRLHALTPELAETELLACCASPAWARGMCGDRPFADREQLIHRANVWLARLSWEEVGQALAAHPRIGERMRASGQEAAWSSREQAGVGGATAAVRVELAEANLAYERRFGHVFLIFASGRDETQILTALRDRMNNDVSTERVVVRGELARIVALRLERLLTERLAG